MKKYISLLVLLMVISISLYSQQKVREQQLLGNWEVVGGEGKEFEQDIIGTVFHFMPSNVLVAEKNQAVINRKYKKEPGI